LNLETGIKWCPGAEVQCLIWAPTCDWIYLYQQLSRFDYLVNYQNLTRNLTWTDVCNPL